MPSDKDIVVEARELAKLVGGYNHPHVSRVPAVLRALADEVERLREELEDASLPRHRDELP